MIEMKLNKRDQRVKDQREKYSLEDVIKKIDYKPLNRRIICLPLINAHLTKGGIIIDGQQEKGSELVDRNLTFRKIVAIDPDSSKRFNLEVGDSIIVDRGGNEFELEEFILNEFLDHEVSGVRKKKDA